ncbi:MAG: hypothetical protein HGB08_02835 [Candidatus Moranbacteria bacterium]|nr:hypothetical protein [Candidatus Moranbacteria bacterium]
MKKINRNSVVIIIGILIGLGFLNYIHYLSKVSSAKNRLNAENEKVVAILNSQNYNVKSLPYAVVDIKDVNDIKVNQDFFAAAEKNDRVYYFENQTTDERLAALYRPETESIINIKKE